MDKTRWDAYRAGEFTIPANDTLGIEIEDTDDPQSGITSHWLVPKSFCNSAGNLQGGVLAAFVDATFGAACAAHIPADHYPALAEMKISFLRPAKADTTIRCLAKVIKPGKRLLFVEAEVRDENDELLAKVSGTEVPAPAP
jgi:uncharacterized protein (TIGR00369 family)